MPSLFRAFRGTQCCALVLALLVSLGHTPALALDPSSEHVRASRDIARQLQHVHYRSLKIDTELSPRILDNYLMALDPQKLYFSAEDISFFESYRYQLDKAVRRGDLQPAYLIYQRFIDRTRERLEHNLALLEKGVDQFDFSVDEIMTLDREDAPWAADARALDELWRKRIKNAVLTQKLEGESEDAIEDSLTRRYSNQLKRISQTQSEDVFQVYMNAVTNTYDPHTVYFSPRNSENFKINMSLSLEGIGAVLQSDNEYTKVVRLVPAGPADKQGVLQPADRIIGVGQGKEGEIVNVVGWRLDEVVDLIRGPRQSLVRLEVIPAKSKGEHTTRTLSIVRDKVNLEEQSARSDTIEINRDGRTSTIGIIQIPTFYADFAGLQRGDPDARSTTRDVYRLIQSLQKEKGIEGLIIDLRDNGGGALQEAIALTGLFIERGPTVQVRTADNRVRVYDDPDQSIAYDGPLAVLVNRMSASASEIFAAAIQDYGRGLIVGEQTFGKGTVQSVRGLSHGQLKITEAKFYRISGGSTQHLGVVPDLLLPSVIDKEQIGEDALPEALPWDKISAVRYRELEGFQPVLETLRESHQRRMLADPEYLALIDEIAYVEMLRARNEISLNLEARKAEMAAQKAEELRVVNKRRKAIGEETFASYEALEAWQADNAGQFKRTELRDFYTRETAEILLDMLRIPTRMAGDEQLLQTRTAEVSG